MSDLQESGFSLSCELDFNLVPQPPAPLGFIKPVNNLASKNSRQHYWLQQWRSSDKKDLPFLYLDWGILHASSQLQPTASHVLELPIYTRHDVPEQFH